MKQLISWMTCINPEERLCAVRVLYALLNPESVDADLNMLKMLNV